MFTLPGPGGGDSGSRTLGDSKPLLRPPGWGWGAAQPPSLRSGPSWLQSAGALQVPEGNPAREQEAASPAASLFRRLLPLSPYPVPVGLPSTVKGYFLLKQVRKSLSSLDKEALHVSALSPSAQTMPDSLTGVGQWTRLKKAFGGQNQGDLFAHPPPGPRKVARTRSLRLRRG